MAERGEPLSDRELDVLQRLAAGESNKAIADGLSISPYTVKTHLRNIYTKLDVSTRTEATTVALQKGVLRMTGGGDPVVAVDGPALESAPSMTNESLPVAIDDSRPETSQQASIAQGGSVVSHRWRMLSVGLLGLFILLASIFLFVQWRSGELAATEAKPFAEQPLGESKWIGSRPLPEARAGRAAAAVGLEVYIIGGELADGVSDDVRVFDTRDRTWRRAAAKPTAVSSVTAADLFGEIFVPGGLLGDGRPTAIAEAYSPSQNAWRRVAPMPRPVSGALALADGGFLYVFGGRDEDGLVQTAYVYDPAADSWRPIAPLPEPRADATGGALTGRFYVVGGTGETGALDSCIVYDPVANNWDTCPDMLQPRVGAGATVLLNKLYVIGGTADPAVGHGEVYDPNSQTWTVLNNPPGVASWADPGVAHVETRIYALGGRVSDALSDGNLVYSPLVFQTFIPAAPSDGE